MIRACLSLTTFDTNDKGKVFAAGHGLKDCRKACENYRPVLRLERKLLNDFMHPSLAALAGALVEHAICCFNG
jgi:hypothetical protein